MIQPPFSRSQRIAQEIKRELAEVLQSEICDPRIERVTLTHVTVSGDLKYANVFYDVPAGANIQDIGIGLSHAASFLRKRLSQRLLLRVIPRINFVRDTGLQHAEHLMRLIEKSQDLSAPTRLAPTPTKDSSH